MIPQVGLDSAFEDEFALANLSGLSPYMGAIFPRQYHYYERYLTFKDATAEEVDAWKRTVLYFFKKVLFRHQVGHSDYLRA
jgi:omega-hydroxy-beta-dihydromenaquinone-9 sulfotransferase